MDRDGLDHLGKPNKRSLFSRLTI